MNKEKNIIRPPVVGVFGHIDHGKSTLLDYIRKTNVAGGEAGGITQRLSAYKVLKKDPAGKDVSITFIDTPGHEAFQALRSRGARVADVAILVVAADEGVKPQTKEALKTIKDAGIPYIVAMNKIDRPNANIEKLKGDLAENEIYIEGYGGDIPAIAVSAVTGAGIPELLEMVLLVAEIADLKARVDLPGEGIVIGSETSKTRGIGATIIVKNGCIKSGMYVVCEDAMAPVRIMENFEGKMIKEAGPSDPILITGFNKMPPVGSILETVATKKEAEAMAEKNKKNVLKIDSVIDIGPADALISIPIIIKASTTDVLEAIIHEIRKIQNDRVAVKIISNNVGFITEGDVKLAMTKEGSLILGFDTKIDAVAKNLSERAGVKIEIFNIIYKLTEWLENEMKERRPKMQSEEVGGIAKVLKCFSRTKDKQIVGCRVEEGAVMVGEEVKIMRREAEIGRGRIRNLQQSKMEVKEVKEGLELGTTIESKMEILPGDKIEAFKVVEN